MKYYYDIDEVLQYIDENRWWLTKYEFNNGLYATKLKPEDLEKALAYFDFLDEKKKNNEKGYLSEFEGKWAEDHREDKFNSIELGNKIEDKTGENEETQAQGISYDDWIAYQKQLLKEQWEREDTIRAETQAREDNAWQRAVEDARKAGVNPNLVNMGPAESGGGITNATGIDNSPLTGQISANASMYATDIQREIAYMNADLERELTKQSNELEKYLAEYNGDLEMALEKYKQNHEKEMEAIAQEFEKEMEAIGHDYDIDILEAQQELTKEQGSKNRITTILKTIISTIKDFIIAKITKGK